MAPFSQASLDAFWSRYVGLSQADVIYTCAQEPVFNQMLTYVKLNGLYGFAPPPGGAAGSNTGASSGYFANVPRFYPPVKS